MFIFESKIVNLFFFFFQAEDGIRDYKVTGVRRVLFRSQSSRCLETEISPRVGPGLRNGMLPKPMLIAKLLPPPEAPVEYDTFVSNVHVSPRNLRNKIVPGLLGEEAVTWERRWPGVSVS